MGKVCGHYSFMCSSVNYVLYRFCQIAIVTMGFLPFLKKYLLKSIAILKICYIFAMSLRARP